MRRLLISLGLAAAVGGAVLGAAATLSIAPTTLGAGATVVASCDTDGVSARLHPTAFYDPSGVAVWVAEFSGIADACLSEPALITVTKDGVALGTADDYLWYPSAPDANYLYGYFTDWPFINAVDVNDLHLVIK